MPEAVVIGAGPGGLSAAAMLQQAGFETVVVDGADAIANSWRGHYDRLHLHTVRWLSALPGMRIPSDEGPWVSRDGVIRYLEAYARRHDLAVRTGVTVERVDPGNTGWLLRCAQGDVAAGVV